jgi:hypothetical protein
MDIFPMLFSSMFSIMGACALVYVAYRAYTIGTEVSEMKELLREIRRASQDTAIGAPVPLTKAARAHHEPGDWPSVADPDYNSSSELDEIKPGV